MKSEQTPLSDKQLCHFLQYRELRDVLNLRVHRITGKPLMWVPGPRMPWGRVSLSRLRFRWVLAGPALSAGDRDEQHSTVFRKTFNRKKA